MIEELRPVQTRTFIGKLFIIILPFFKCLFKCILQFFKSIFYIIKWILNIIRRFFLKIKDILFYVILLIFVSLSVHFLIYGNLGYIGVKFNDLVRKTNQFCRNPFRPFRPFSGVGTRLGQ